MKNMKTAAEVMLDVLYESGVRHVFGIPGGNCIPIYDALTHHSLDLVLTLTWPTAMPAPAAGSAWCA